MTRSELIQALSMKQSHLTAKEIEAAVKCVLDYMAESLKLGKRIEIRGFGSFSIRFRPSRLARNPKTGEQVLKKAKYSLHFKPGKEMRDRVDRSASEYPLIEDEKHED
jgi:integration host factor subunit beta